MHRHHTHAARTVPRAQLRSRAGLLLDLPFTPASAPWAATLWPDVRSPGGWCRLPWSLAPQRGWILPVNLALGDIVEFEFSVATGAQVGVGDEIGSIEGLKAVTSVFSAGTGRFAGEGSELRQDVTLAETDPYGKGWLYRLQGEPAGNTVDVHGYVAILDATIDKMLASRHAGGGANEE